MGASNTRQFGLKESDIVGAVTLAGTNANAGLGKEFG